MTSFSPKSSKSVLKAIISPYSPPLKPSSINALLKTPKLPAKKLTVGSVHGEKSSPMLTGFKNPTARPILVGFIVTVKKFALKCSDPVTWSVTSPGRGDSPKLW